MAYIAAVAMSPATPRSLHAGVAQCRSAQSPSIENRQRVKGIRTRSPHKGARDRRGRGCAARTCTELTEPLVGSPERSARTAGEIEST